jgi:hypothetical protein
MSCSTHHKTAPVFSMILLVCSFCHATTVAFVVTPYGILVGTDSGNTDRSQRRINKAIIIQRRLVVTSVGAADIDFDSFYYHFIEWIAAVEKKCPKNVSVSALTSLLEVESRATFKDFDRIIASGALDRKKTPYFFIQYFVTGYQSGIPTMTTVYFKIDWKKRRLTGPVVEEIYPSHNSRVDFGFFGGGYNEVFSELQDRKSDAYKEMLALIPNELPKLLSQQNLSLSEGTNACLAAMRYEAKHHKPLVAPPYVMTTIPPLGMGTTTQTTYPR